MLYLLFSFEIWGSNWWNSFAYVLRRGQQRDFFCYGLVCKIRQFQKRSLTSRPKKNRSQRSSEIGTTFLEIWKLAIWELSCYNLYSNLEHLVQQCRISAKNKLEGLNFLHVVFGNPSSSEMLLKQIIWRGCHRQLLGFSLLFLLGFIGFLRFFGQLLFPLCFYVLTMPLRSENLQNTFFPLAEFQSSTSILAQTIFMPEPIIPRTIWTAEPGKFVAPKSISSMSAILPGSTGLIFCCGITVRNLGNKRERRFVTHRFGAKIVPTTSHSQLDAFHNKSKAAWELDETRSCTSSFKSQKRAAKTKATVSYWCSFSSSRCSEHERKISCKWWDGEILGSKIGVFFLSSQ